MLLSFTTGATTERESHLEIAFHSEKVSHGKAPFVAQHPVFLGGFNGVSANKERTVKS